MTPPALPKPPDPFPAANIHIIPAATLLHRTHSATLRPAQLNPCLGQPTRFAPIRDLEGVCVPSLYAATTEEAAAFESIFHDIEASAAFKTVRLDVVTARSLSQVAPKRDLRLVALFGPDLKAWGRTRMDLIDTPKSTYSQTVTWAQAIHVTHSDADGLAWTSRQCDPAICIVLFGDRVTEADLSVVRRSEASEPAVLLRLRGYGLRAGITIV